MCDTKAYIDFQMSGQLDMIIGCMFSQKTTRLIESIRKHRLIGNRLLVLTHKLDTRYNSNGQVEVVSHDLIKNAVAVTRLMDVSRAEHPEHSNLMMAHCVFIEEAQFFTDLEEFVKMCVSGMKKYVCLSGLDGDFRRLPFKNIMNLIPYADNVTKCKALCMVCKDGTLAPFTKKISVRDADNSDLGESSNIEVGGAELYKPMCRYHYENS